MLFSWQRPAVSDVICQLSTLLSSFYGFYSRVLTFYSGISTFFTLDFLHSTITLDSRYLLLTVNRRLLDTLG